MTIENMGSAATRHCSDCGFDINLGDWDEHKKAEAWDAINNHPEFFCEVGHE